MKKILGLAFSVFMLASFSSFAEDFEVLQGKEDGIVEGQYYLGTAYENITWGRLPNKDSKPVMTVSSGATVTIDTLSHEGVLEDQGKDPVKYFMSKGVPENQILNIGKELTASDKPHDFDKDGPHVVTGPIYVEGAEPGDVLKVEVLSLYPRVPYGVISNRHFKGVLAGEFPENEGRLPGADKDHPERYNNISIFTPIKKIGDEYFGYLNENGHELSFPLFPFLGIMGVANATSESLSSIPPTRLGGNLDINELGVGSTLYLPVDVKGALFFTGDPHFVQGDGEVALTALEGSLRGTVRLTVLKKGSSAIPGNPEKFDMCFGETEDFWIPIGLNQDLDEAMKQSVRESINFLSKQTGIDRKTVYAYLSAATDYKVSQAVDKTKDIHALIQKRDFKEFIKVLLADGKTTVPATIQKEGLFVNIKLLAGLTGGKVAVKKDSATLTVNGISYTFTAGSNRYSAKGSSVILTKSPYIDGGFYIPTDVILKIMKMPLTWSSDGTVITGKIGF